MGTKPAITSQELINLMVKKRSCLLTEGITGWLVRWNQGEQGAKEEVTSLLYHELRRRAAAYLRGESNRDLLQTTALVHETYLELRKLDQIEWQNRSHFVAICSQLMRRILLEHARKRHAGKRGGSGVRKITLDPELLAVAPDFDILALDEALERLERDHPRQAKIVELRFYGGLTNPEALEVLGASHPGISLRTVERDWRFARAWLFDALSGGEPAA